MSGQEEIIKVPDIGTDDEVEVIEVNVQVGSDIEEEDTLITLESEKASMEIPSPKSGLVKSLLVKVGDKVKMGSEILSLEQSSQEVSSNVTSESTESTENKKVLADSSVSVVSDTSVANDSKQATVQPSNTQSSTPKIIEVTVPDIGTDDKVEVIEIQAKPGDAVEQEDSLITLESEKASMDIPCPEQGVITEIKVKVGDKISEGDLILYLQIQGTTTQVSSTSTDTLVPAAPVKTEVSDAQPVKSAQTTTTKANSAKENINVAASNKYVYASPSVRRFANDLGVDLTTVVGTGRKGRLLKTDIEQYVKAQLTKVQSGATAGVASGSGNGLEVAALPKVDYSKFGPVTEKPLSRIKKLSAANLHRNWVVVPHVTQFDEADISDMESFRQKYKKQAQDKGYKLTPLVFLMRAAAQALKLMPQFNVSLANDGQSLIQKDYFHIGIAVDTPNGLVVPVIRDVDQKGLFQLAQELAEVSIKARDGKLTAKDMQGGCFSISSLGGIGGTAFTPIVNVPDVAILGVSKSQMKPVYQDGEFVPRLMLPLSLSYDHRAIDGADAARFITIYSQLLGDISQLLL